MRRFLKLCTEEKFLQRNMQLAYVFFLNTVTICLSLPGWQFKTFRCLVPTRKCSQLYSRSLILEIKTNFGAFGTFLNSYVFFIFFVKLKNFQIFFRFRTTTTSFVIFNYFCETGFVFIRDQYL